MSYDSHRIVSYGPYRLAFDMGAYQQYVVVSGDDVIPAGSIIVNAWLQNYSTSLAWSNVSNDVDVEAILVTDDGDGTIADWSGGNLSAGGLPGGSYLRDADNASAIRVLLDAQIGFTVLGDNEPLQGTSDLTLLVILPS